MKAGIVTARPAPCSSRAIPVQHAHCAQRVPPAGPAFTFVGLDGHPAGFIENFKIGYRANWKSQTQREVLGVQILTEEERDFPFRGGYRFQDPESGAEILTDAVAARADFLQRFGTARALRATRLASAGVRHAEYVLDQPIDAPLRRFFALRAGQATLEDA